MMEREPRPGEILVAHPITQEECPWLTRDYPAGTVLYAYGGYTYDCISIGGVAITEEPEGERFLQVPREAVLKAGPNGWQPIPFPRGVCRRGSRFAFHGSETLKQAVLRRIARHRERGELQRGLYWEHGVGTPVGCTLHSRDFHLYRLRLGIPPMFGMLEEALFSGLRDDDALVWPERLLSAIRPGCELGGVPWQFLQACLTDPTINPGIEHPTVSKAVALCARVLAPLHDPVERPAEERVVARIGARIKAAGEATSGDAKYAAAVAYRATCCVLEHYQDRYRISDQIVSVVNMLGHYRGRDIFPVLADRLVALTRRAD